MSTPQTPKPEGGGKKSIAIKVYLVMLRHNLPKQGEPNVEVIAAKLTREAAEAIRAKQPGTYIEKHIATK